MDEKKNNILDSTDIVWVDYILLLLWGKRLSEEMNFILGRDIPSIPNTNITFAIIYELYLIGVVTELGINVNLKRVVTFTEMDRGSLKAKNISNDYFWINYYGVLERSDLPCTIILKFSSKNLKSYLNKRQKLWENGNFYKETVSPFSIQTQKNIVGNWIVSKIKGEGYQGKNLLVPCINFLKDTSKNSVQNLITSNINPFLVLYSFDREKILSVTSMDNSSLLISLNADICVSEKRKLYTEAVINKYGFEVPINKKKDGIFFDKDSGFVFIKGKKVPQNLRRNTQPYNLFLSLYENQGVWFSNENILKKLESIQSSDDKAVGRIKADLPTEIRNLIESSKGVVRLKYDTEI